MISRFFIERPILANVLAIVTVIVGLVAADQLPIEQYPQITPPTVRVTTNYPGGSAQTVADTVAAPIEQQVNGVEHMLYMLSTSGSDGSYSLTITFDVGTNVDMAQVLVQNRVQFALPQLPLDVQRQGIVTKKQSTNIIQFVTLTSPDERYDSLFLANYATINIRDELARLPGVGDITVVGAANYSMRIWLNPDKLKSLGLTAEDVVTAVREQNVQVAAGHIGEPPAPPDQGFEYTVRTLGRLKDPRQFGNIIIKVERGPTARVTRVKDVARVELGGQVYNQYFTVNGKPAAGVAIFQLPGANALDVAQRVRQRMEVLKTRFPAGVQYSIPFDTTLFVSAAIHEVYRTLLEAGVLVLLVIVIFLQDWRATLVPATTIPVTIIGAFAGMYLLGYTINMLTLFGLVLAIGIVVDDAIVIVENAAHYIQRGMPPKEATIQAMDELVGPIIGITLVLAAVFVPASFLGGVTGQLYRQFALTIGMTAVISAINALTLKPAQTATWLRPTTKRTFVLFRWFNAGYERLERVYARAVHWVVHHIAVTMIGFVLLAAATAWGFVILPTGFLPVEDQGYFIVSAQLPDGASQDRTRRVVAELTRALSATPGIENVNAIGGQNVFEQTVSSNAAAFYVTFKDWSERTASESQNAVLAELQNTFRSIPEAVVIAFPPPAIRGLGVTGGFQMEIENIGNASLSELEHVTRDMVAAGNAQSELQALSSPFSASVPQIYLNIDRVKVKSLEVPLDQLFAAIQTYLGTTYANDFNEFGRTYQVRLQSEARFRNQIDDIPRLEVRNRNGQMVPLGTVLTMETRLGPQTLSRYNLYPAASITGQAAPGVSSSDALAVMEEMAQQQLPSGMAHEWTAMSYQEKQAGSQSIYVFGFAVLMVYLILAGRYESWTSPMAVILVVPLALLGTLAAVAVRGTDNNVYTQMGIVLIIALASKNAILIVEFAQDLRGEGMEIAEAAAEAAERRLRPILMTSLAFVLGVLPLVFARGAAASSQQTLGTAVVGGMLASTLLSIFFVPAFFVLAQHASILWRNFRKRANK